MLDFSVGRMVISRPSSVGRMVALSGWRCLRFSSGTPKKQQLKDERSSAGLSPKIFFLHRPPPADALPRARAAHSWLLIADIFRFDHDFCNIVIWLVCFNHENDFYRGFFTYDFFLFVYVRSVPTLCLLNLSPPKLF